MDPPSDDVAASKPASTPEPAASVEPAIREDASAQAVANAGLLKECLDLALNFLSTSSNEKLLGVFALLALGTYIILGRIGLLLIGTALGFILHASWEAAADGTGDDRSPTLRKRRELALEVSKRLLDWPQRVASDTDVGKNDSILIAEPEGLSTADLEYASFRPATASALRSLTEAVVKDYVK